VSSLERANTELKKAQAEIVRAEKLASVGRLSAGIAHEIGNPIGIVAGYLELMKKNDITDDERIEYLDRAENEIERISTIIRQLLDISRPSPDGSRMVSVHALIREMTSVLKMQPFTSHVRLSIDLSAPNDNVTADPNQLRQVFLNLIINAADAISSKGPDASGDLIISTENATAAGRDCSDSTDWLHIHFRDNGIGIPEETQANIFDPFFTTKDPGKGTGLGLSVSFMIIGSAGGRMNVASEVEKGTMMTISLPLVMPQTA
jgi:signal transduction histidine kinase